jgi:hypothetical protein
MLTARSKSPAREEDIITWDRVRFADSHSEAGREGDAQNIFRTVHKVMKNKSFSGFEDKLIYGDLMMLILCTRFSLQTHASNCQS